MIQMCVYRVHLKNEFYTQSETCSSLFSFLFMDWVSYQKRFKISAKLRGYSDNQISPLLDYAKKLHDSYLPIIFNSEHFSRLLGVEKKYLYDITNERVLSYREFYIPKHNGEKRIIAEPSIQLKRIQKWILFNILKKVDVSPFSKAYLSGTSIKENAKFHINQPTIIKLDIKDFFLSIKQHYVVALFKRLGYNLEVAGLLARLCCYNGCLPQGAPTSPYISNLFCRRLDNRIGHYVVKIGLRYTRYSDDITISGDVCSKQIGSILRFCNKCIFEENLMINNEKTQVIPLHKRQVVTGITVNDKLSIGVKKKKEIRKQIYFIRKYGIESHVRHEHIEERNYLYHLAGLINWVLYVERNNEEFLNYKSFINYLIKGKSNNCQ